MMTHVRRLLSLVIVLVFIFPVVTPARANQFSTTQTSNFDTYPQADEGTVVEPNVRLLDSSTAGVTFEVSIPWQDLSLETVVHDSVSFTRVSLPGWSSMPRAGAPALPMRVEQLGVPFGAEVGIQVTPGVSHIQVLSFPVQPVMTQDVIWGAPSDEVDPQPSMQKVFSYKQDAEIYAQNSAYPADLAEVSNDGVLRQQRVVGIAVNPVQFNPQTLELTVYESLTVTVSFSGSTSPMRGSLANESDIYNELLGGELLNYESAINWRQTEGLGTSEPTVEALSGLPWEPPAPGWRIQVKDEGIYKLTYTELDNAGLPVETLDPDMLQLFNLGNEVSIFVEGAEDGSFDDGDYVLFFGQAHETKYSEKNIYWLTYDKADGLRMGTRDVAVPPGSTEAIPSSYEAFRHMEDNSFYIRFAPGDENQDRWFWNYYYTPSIPSWTYGFTLGLPYVGPAKLKLSMLGFVDLNINPDHHAIIYVNNNKIGEYKWDGITWQVVEMDILPGILTPGINQLKVEFGGGTGSASDTVWFDWAELTYANNFVAESDELAFSFSDIGTWKYEIDGFSTDQYAAFDVTDPLAVIRLTGVGALAGSPHKAQFQDEVSSRTDYRVMTGSSYRAVDSITADTPSSLASPSNAVDYILITHADFSSAAQAMVDHRASQGLSTKLVDVQDIYDEFGYGIEGVEPIKSFLSHTYTSWPAPAPSYVVLLGDANYDPRNYSGSGRVNYIPTNLGPWDPFIRETATDNRYVTLSGSDNLADMMLGRLSVNSPAEAATIVNKIINYETAPVPGTWGKEVLAVADMADGAGDFAQYSDDVLDCCVPDNLIEQKVYYNVTHTNLADARAAIRDGISAGKFIVNYIGHGWYGGWANVDLLTTNDIPLLSNGGKLPIVLAMTCQDGYFIHTTPAYESIAEKLTRKEGGGAVASWSATGDGLTAAHDYLNRGFLTALLINGVETLGQATTAGELALFATNADLDLLDTYLLFGDPAMRVPAPPVRPVGQAPSGTISSLNPTFVWSAVGGAEQYNLVVSSVGSGPFYLNEGGVSVTESETTEILNISVPVSNCSSGECSFAHTPSLNLQPGAYEWKVRADKGGGVFSDFSDNLQFTNLAVPLPATPAGKITSRNPKFTWILASGATKYRLLIKQGGTIFKQQEVTSPVCGTTKCSFTFPTSLALANNQYTWSVQAYFGFWGEYGLFKTFTVLNPPVPKFPAVSTTSANPKFIWTKVAGQTKYQFILYDANNQVVLKQLIAAPVCTTTTCSYTPSPVLGLKNGAYKWKIQSFNGIWGAFSGLKAFNKVNPPAPISPKGNVYIGNPTFKWVKIPGASKYNLVLQTATGATVKSLEIPSSSCGISNCIFLPNPALGLKAGSYKWKIRAYNGYYGPFSSYMLFTRK